MNVDNRSDISPTCFGTKIHKILLNADESPRPVRRNKEPTRFCIAEATTAITTMKMRKRTSNSKENHISESQYCSTPIAIKNRLQQIEHNRSKPTIFSLPCLFISDTDFTSPALLILNKDRNNKEGYRAPDTPISTGYPPEDPARLSMRKDDPDSRRDECLCKNGRKVPELAIPSPTDISLPFRWHSRSLSVPY
jgi:hypothetical protein